MYLHQRDGLKGEVLIALSSRFSMNIYLPELEGFTNQKRKETLWSERACGVLKCGNSKVGHKRLSICTYESNCPGSRVHTGLSCPCEFAEINKVLYEWYPITHSKNNYLGGPQLHN